ncbi:coenzyme F420-0:L-glutamate ligase [Anaerococcus sp. ENR1011]|uniref:Coenzyme F420-0:L-glutamate ligase n=1 Tax=Anaerococcus groningensis TaxID=3115616 RepID=A0ABW9N1R2_9FIRM
MERIVGTRSLGLRAPIIEKGDDLEEIVFETVKRASENHNITINDKDVVCVTESLVARAQGNYASIEQIAKDINNKFDGDELVVLFPILSRNRFSILLKAIALSGKKLHICLSYPQDEVGNYLMDEMDLFNSNINPYQDVLDIDQFRKIAGEYRHTFTGMDYPALYTELAPNSEIHFLNNPVDSLKFADEVLVCSIHTRNIIKRQLKEAGGKNILSLDDILNEPVEGSGFNKDYGLLGSNLSTEGEVKLFPRDGEDFVANLQKKLVNHFDKQIEVMIYGDGAFKDPVGKIWELADPIVSPAFTKGLSGTPSELKIKYIADNEFSDLSIEERTSAMVARISKKEKELVGKNETLGTTPRQITDLLGSLADLTSGSGDKGTPIVLIQGYFDNYSDN